MKVELNFGYTVLEEKINVWSHAFGLLVSIVAFPFLIMKAMNYDGFWKPASFIIYGLSLIILYAASTFYHNAKEPVKRRKLNIFDHSAIYVLIAGSYTPFCFVALDSSLGNYMAIFVWIFALVGVFLKLFFTGRFNIISTAMYLLMGWQFVFLVNPLMESLSSFSLNLLYLGGVFYSIGAVLYLIRKLRYNHAIFHLFVLLGSFSHFLSIYLMA